MHDGVKNFGVFVAAAAMVWHFLSVLSPAWVLTQDQQQARDFATYYYAVQVAKDGGNPYVRSELNDAAREEGSRRTVHPFLYAPPFLLASSWMPAWSLGGAFHLWFWLDEICAIAAGLALWGWWRRQAGLVIVVVMALMTAIPNNHSMGQANFPGLLLAILGLWQVDEGRPKLGGALMGLACMLKMSPALFVIYWMIRREWVAVAASIVSAFAVSVLSLPIASYVTQLTFYVRILPTFSTGDYNGLSVPIELFGNHSLPNLFDAILPADGHPLSVGARALSAASTLALLGVLAWGFRFPTTDAFTRAAQASCFGVLLLLVPVYTYEHHLVFAIPAAVIAVVAVTSGRLGPGWAVPVGLAVTVLCFDLQVLKALAEGVPTGLVAFGAIVREAKFASLVVLLAATERIGHTAAAPAPIRAGAGVDPAGAAAG